MCLQNMTYLIPGVIAVQNITETQQKDELQKPS